MGDAGQGTVCVLVKAPLTGGCPQRLKQQSAVTPHASQSLLLLSQPSKPQMAASCTPSSCLLPFTFFHPPTLELEMVTFYFPSVRSSRRRRASASWPGSHTGRELRKQSPRLSSSYTQKEKRKTETFLCPAIEVKSLPSRLGSGGLE